LKTGFSKLCLQIKTQHHFEKADLYSNSQKEHGSSV